MDVHGSLAHNLGPVAVAALDGWLCRDVPSDSAAKPRQRVLRLDGQRFSMDTCCLALNRRSEGCAEVERLLIWGTATPAVAVIQCPWHSGRLSGMYKNEKEAGNQMMEPPASKRSQSSLPRRLNVTVVNRTHLQQFAPSTIQGGPTRKRQLAGKVEKASEYTLASEHCQQVRCPPQSDQTRENRWRHSIRSSKEVLLHRESAASYESRLVERG